MKTKRVISPHIESQGSTEEAFLAVLKDEAAKELVAETEPEVPPPESIPEIREPTPDIDNYLRRQVMKEMYGTEEPTQYERTIQALRNKL